MVDVAAQVGLHQTTVSLALRNDPSIPPATRERIYAAAAALGYRPNPLLDAFNFNRLVHHAVKSVPTIALVIDEQSNQFFHTDSYHPLVYEGMKAEAAHQGLRIDLFVTGPRWLGAPRLNRVLTARGISGMIVATINREVERLELDWSRLCAVKIESQHMWPPLDVVSNDQWQSTRTAFVRLRELGYRRIGLAICREDEVRLSAPFRTGLLVEQALVAETERVAPLLFDHADAPRLRTRLTDWIRREKVDVVVSNWNSFAADLGRAGFDVPREVAVASLDKPLGDTGLAGVVQNHELVGRRAVELVRNLMQVSLRGIPVNQAVTFVPGYWVDGASAPPRAVGA